MFICSFCCKSSSLQEKCTPIITKRRLHQHPFRPKINRKRGEDGKWMLTPDTGGRGWQIAEEKKACSQCRDKIQAGTIIVKVEEIIDPELSKEDKIVEQDQYWEERETERKRR